MLIICGFISSLSSLKAQAYAELNDAPGNGIYRVENNELLFTFFEPYHHDQRLEFDIRDENSNVILDATASASPPTQFVVDHTRGKNKVDLDLSSLGLVSGTYYQLRVFAGKGDTYYLTFLKP